MMAALWFLLVLTLVTSGSCVHGGNNLLSEPSIKFRNFAAKIEGRRLNGSVVKELNVTKEISCQFECVADKRCLSYNLVPFPGMEILSCQLSASDRFVGYKNFTNEDSVIYRGIQSICERASPCAENEVCIADYKSDHESYLCRCFKECPRHCKDLYQNGFTTDGVYLVYPENGEPLEVLCDMTTEGGGWTVFQRRMDGSVDFYLNWESYKTGFGDLNGEFWLGNDNLHRLSANANMMLRVDLEDYDGIRKYAEYTTFSVAGASDNYRLAIGGYRGTAGDSLGGNCAHANMMFTTKDRDNDVGNGNCASAYTGAWWYRGCHCSNLNGLYQGGGHAQGVTWYSFRGHDYSLKHAEMKFRPNTA